MYYELYVDVLFLVNFTMDYLLLLMVRRMLRCSATHGYICLGAMVGAALTCLVMILPIPYPFIKFVLFHVVVNTCMIRVGLKIKTIQSFVKAIVMLYIGGFLLGGILESFQQYVRYGSLFLVVAVAGYYLAMGIWKFIQYVQRWNQYHCEVELVVGGKTYLIKGIIDTGNSLSDPISQKPVSILSRKVARDFFGEKQVNDIRYIPYCSIGKREGVLPAIQIDRMCVRGEQMCWIESPLIGISEEEISAGGEYEMILNPNLF